MRVAAIVVAAGSGERFGARKQFEDLAGATPVVRSVAGARAVADLVVAVLPADDLDHPCGADVVVAGGPTRSASVRAGLAAVPGDVDVVVVHDAARPLATPALYRAVVDALAADGAVGAIPGVAVPDTIKQTADGAVVATLDRTTLVAVQTPQAFAADALRVAHEGAPEATDDAALVEARGGRVVVVPGEPSNRKLTTTADLDAMRAELAGA